MKLLFAYYDYIEPDTNAGGFRNFEIIKMLLHLGAEVTMLSMRNHNERYRGLFSGFGIDCITDGGSLLNFQSGAFHEFLSAKKFDIAVLSDCGVYNHYGPYIRSYLPNCRMVFDTIDLKSRRLVREAGIKKSVSKQLRSLLIRQEEKRAITDADRTWVVTDDERTLVEAGIPNNHGVDVIPTIHQVADTIPPWEARNGIVFLGGYKHSPNVDAVNHFMHAIYPLLKDMMPTLPITIAGSNPPPDFQKYESQHPLVHVTGFIVDHRELLLKNRIGIAPLRFGAGMKGKIGEYLSCGLPCVTTAIGAEGMGLTNMENIVVADGAAAFVEAIVKLYTDRQMWGKLSANGTRYIKQRLSLSAVKPAVLASISALMAAPHTPSPAAAATWVRHSSAFSRRLLKKAMLGDR